ncbi:MAG: hypothetical protein H6811_02395 [Phycisphaeraceae bacterium]|nr:hypothetical protein [Phycisphaeraceae bacterium]
MVGVIWFVQVVHYPLLARVGTGVFAGYHAAHVRRTSMVVMLPMLVEVVASVMLVVRAGEAGPPRWMGLAGLVLLAIVWVSTFAVQVPLHDRLGRSGSARAIRALVATNWVRTTGWTARGALAVAMVDAAR